MKNSFKKNTYNNIPKYEGKIYLNCCVGVEYDLDLLEYSINYYKKLGVDELFYILNTTDTDSPNLKKGIKILDKYPDIHRDIWIGKYTSLWKKEKENEIVKDYINEDDWIMTVDVDEFYEFPMNIKSLIILCEEKGYHYIKGKFIDRISKDCKLKPINKNKTLWEQYPVNNNLYYLIKNITNGYNFNYNKILLRKNFVELSTGQHEVKDKYKYRRYLQNLDVHHFRWRKGLINKLEERANIKKKYKLGFDNEYYALKKICKYYKKYKKLE